MTELKRVFSGVKPTGVITLGNYLGAIKRFVDIQDKADENFYSVVDLHALTVAQNPKELYENTLNIAAVYLAVGLNPEKSTLFVQSHVPAHAEAGWMLTCLSRMGELNRMTQFKDKGKGSDSAGVGLFTYPTLMAADILLYQTTSVPVGEDQKQHIELTRDLAERFNRDYGETFVIPEPVIAEVGARIMGLQSPEKKMSKSDDSDANYITLMDTPKQIEKKIKRAVTDSENAIYFDEEKKPGVSNLLTIQSVLTGESIENIVQSYEGLGYGALKRNLIEIMVDHLAPIQQRYQEIRQSDELSNVLCRGAEQAEAVAGETLRKMKDALGLVRL